MAEQTQTPHVVIIGGGFGGLEAAKKLGSQPLRLTVIDRTNYHLFQPLLYQVATRRFRRPTLRRRSGRC
jgi:NADH dehydrogenase